MLPKEEREGGEGRQKRAKVEGEWVVDTEKKVVLSKDGRVRLAVLDRVLIRIQVIQPQPNRPKLSLSYIELPL